MYFLVKRTHGPSWDPSRLRREQDGWDAHAAFMDRLVENGFVVLGGPVGEGDGDYALQVVEANSEAQVRARLADDPGERTCTSRRASSRGRSGCEVAWPSPCEVRPAPRRPAAWDERWRSRQARMRCRVRAE